MIFFFIKYGVYTDRLVKFDRFQIIKEPILI